MPLVTAIECVKCGRTRGERHKTVTKRPTLARLERFVSEAAGPATDGCRVEPDGECEHGHTSWLRVLGFV